MAAVLSSLQPSDLSSGSLSLQVVQWGSSPVNQRSGWSAVPLPAFNAPLAATMPPQPSLAPDPDSVIHNFRRQLQQQQQQAAAAQPLLPSLTYFPTLAP